MIRFPSASASACSTASAIAGPALRVRLQPVDDDLDGVLDALVELQVVGQLHELAVDAGADVAALHHVGEEVLELALLAANHRGEHQKPRALRQREDAADDLLAGLGRDRPVALRAVALAEPGVQHAEEVRDLGDGADRRSRVAAGGLLLDADRRREPADVIDVRLGKLAEELPGVAGQGLDVPPLALGVDRVERERDFSRAADAGEDDQLVAGEFEIDVAEVVFAGAPDDDGLSVHEPVYPVGGSRIGRVIQLVY